MVKKSLLQFSSHLQLKKLNSHSIFKYIQLDFSINVNQLKFNAYCTRADTGQMSIEAKLINLFKSYF